MAHSLFLPTHTHQYLPHSQWLCRFVSRETEGAGKILLGRCDTTIMTRLAELNVLQWFLAHFESSAAFAAAQCWDVPTAWRSVRLVRSEPSSHSRLQAACILFLRICLFQTLRKNGSMQQVVFCVWCLSLSVCFWVLSTLENVAVSSCVLLLLRVWVWAEDYVILKLLGAC